MKKVTTVDEYISQNIQWEKSLLTLRNLIISEGLSETVKWEEPVYTFDGKNVIGLGVFKNFLSMWFFQGALLMDKNKKLINAQEGKTKALRQWRFGSNEEIKKELKIIQNYIKEAKINQKEGKEIKPDRNKPVIIPDELANLISKKQKIKKAFYSLSLSKQREYAEYISEAKRDDTKQKRLAKISPIILERKGLHDKYRPNK